MYFVKAQESPNEWWRYLLTLFPGILAYLVFGAIPLMAVIAVKTAQGKISDPSAFLESYDPELLGISQNFGLSLLLIPSVLGFFVLWIMIKAMHRRSSGDIASAEGKIRWNRLLYSALLWFVLLLLAEITFFRLYPENYQLQFDAQHFFPLLIIAFILIPFQTWFEELLFRSYLMQGIGLLFGLRIVALLITSIGFGLLHMFNPEVKEFGLGATMPYYIGFGIFAGILVIMDNGIELACGVHAINNIYSAVLVNYESSVLKTPAIWTIQEIKPWAMNLAFLLMALVFIIIMQRKFQWNNWKRIFHTIEKSQNHKFS